MKKKNLIILLIIPFIISLLGIVTINVSINTFYGDITGIQWEYDEVEAFELKDTKYLLKATPLNASNAPLDSGNGLIWSCENKDVTIEEPIAEIYYEKNNYYLQPNTEGEVIVTCSNLKGNIFRKMTAIIYTDGVVIITPEISGSQNNIDENIYYGQYDLVNNEKKEATFNLNVKCIPEEIIDSLSVFEKTDNIEFNTQNKKVTIKGIGQANLVLSAAGNKTSYSFNIVENGVNVYSYEDLLNCTNKSNEGEIVCLRKSFESLTSYNSKTTNNVELFGKQVDGKFNFINDIYRFTSTYNIEYLKQWNNFVEENGNLYSKVEPIINVGLRVQKDFYGNGYTINMHNLTYPSMVTQVDNGGTIIEIPTLSLIDLFRGPLPFYTLGDPNGLPLVTAFGQDNVGMYVDGNNITINDVNIINADLKGSMSFLNTVGTVMDVHGDNVTVKNSRLSNGKNVLRTFSTSNFTLDNSLLSNARNFLLEVGSDEFMSYDEVSKFEFSSSTDGSKINSTLPEYLGGKDSKGDVDLTNYIMGKFTDSNMMKNSILAIQNALNNREAVEGLYAGNVEVNDTYFYNSGISAIALNNMFNGPFLYSPLPSMVTDVFSMMSMEGKPVIPYTPTKVGGLSYPMEIELKGKTKFFDYKDSNNIDITGLVSENISVIAREVFGKDKEINIDTVFPIKPLLLNGARNQGSIYADSGISYINIPIAFYGGGLNLSTVNISNLEGFENLNEEIEINFLDQYLKPGNSGDMMSMMKDIMLKAVTIVSGYEPFRFVCIKGNGYLFGETPKVSDLIANAKGV